MIANQKIVLSSIKGFIAIGGIGAMLIAGAGCGVDADEVASVGEEAPLNLGIASRGVKTGQGAYINCQDGGIYLHPNGLLKSCTLQLNTAIVTATRIHFAFKSSTDITLDEDGYLQEGTLLSNSAVKTGTGSSYAISPVSPLILYKTGYLQRGTLSVASAVETGTGTYYAITSASPLYLYETGYLKEGTLATNSAIKTASGYRACKGGFAVRLLPSGYLDSCNPI